MTDTAVAGWRRIARGASLLAAIAIATGLVGCGGAAMTPTTSATATPTTSATPTPTTSATATRTTSATPTATTTVATSSTGTAGHADVSSRSRARADARARPARARPTTIAVLRRAVPMRSAPGHAGHVLGTLATRTQFGSATAVPVVTRRGAWLGVTSLLAGNGRFGWIPRSAVALSSTAWRIYLSIDRQQITVSYGNEIIRRIPTSTGVEGASTPTGHFAVTDRLRTGVEYGPYGCCILALSAVQPRHLSDWDGGDRIAIHATNAVADLGRPASHGCAHVSDAEGHWLLAHIPNGTPVVIENAPLHRGRGSPA